jgi:putative ABC transport system permease protein
VSAAVPAFGATRLPDVAQAAAEPPAGTSPGATGRRALPAPDRTGALPDRRRTALRGSRIGFVFQSFHLLPYRTVEENVMLAVIGILGGFKREQRLSTSVLLPPPTAKDRVGLDLVSRVLVNTSLGAARQVAGQSATAPSPNNAKALTVLAPADLSKARKGVQGDVNGLFRVLGLVSLIVGAIGIANATLVTVMERVGEIGLRRALGASRRQIAGQFLAESTTIGLLGRVVGAALGAVVVVSVSGLKDWTPVLDGRLALGAPAVGALVGLLAGVYPSLRASRMEPVEGG